MSRLLALHASRIVFALLITLYVFVNLAFTTWTESILLVKDLGAPLIVILLLGAWMLGDLAGGRPWTLPRHDLVTPTVLALLGWLVTVIVSPATASGILEWGRAACCFITLWAALHFIDSEARLRVALRAVITVNAIVILYGLAQLAGFDPLEAAGLIHPLGEGTFVSTHGNPNFLAGYIITTLPLIAGLAIAATTPAAMVGLSLLALLNLYELIESTARGAYLAAAITLPCFAAGLFFRTRYESVPDRRRMMMRAASALALVVALLVAANSERVLRLGPLVARQAESLTNFEDNYANQVRIVFWRTALDAALRAPWLGRGLGSFNQVMPESRPTDYHRVGVSHNTIHAHNEHLEWLAETGIVGLALFWWLLAAYAASALALIRSLRASPLFPVALGAALGPVALWIQSTFDVETRWTGNAITLWWTAGLAFAVGRIAANDDPSPIMVSPSNHERRGNSNRHSFDKIRTSGAGGPARGIVPAASPYLPYAAACFLLVTFFYGHRAARAFEADHAMRTVTAFTDGAAKEVFPLALKESLRIASLTPDQYPIYYKLAFVLLYAGRPADALEAYRALQAYAPHYAQVHMNIAFIDQQLGYRTAAAWEYERMAELEHNTRNHRQAARAWLELSEPGRARPHLRAAITIDRDRTPEGYHFWVERDAIHIDLARIALSEGNPDAAAAELADAVGATAGDPGGLLKIVKTSLETTDSRILPALARALEHELPGSPAAPLLELALARRDRDDALVLTAAERIAAALTLPERGGPPRPDASPIGNEAITAMQELLDRRIDPALCLEIAGWIYGCQGRLDDAERTLKQAYELGGSPRCAARLEAVRERKK
jgi:O-antigen ligase